MCAEVAWVAKRWSRARLLKICIQQDNTKELSQALSCHETRNLACLQEVRHRLCCTVLGVDEPRPWLTRGLLSASCTFTLSIATTRHARLPGHCFSHRPATSRWCPNLHATSA